MAEVFIEMHQGYRLKEAITAQSENGERLRWAMDAGGMLWDPTEQSYGRWMGGDEEAQARQPHIVGISRELELRSLGSFIGVLFRYQTPRILFTRGEQRLLRAALRGCTDEELSAELAISAATVKNLWSSIYNRSAAHISEDGLNAPRGDGGVRGKERRRRLLAYLREHPEELRPISRKILESQRTANV